MGKLKAFQIEIENADREKKNFLAWLAFGKMIAPPIFLQMANQTEQWLTIHMQTERTKKD